MKDAEPDGYIKITDFWTKLKKDGKILPHKGYASYRYKVINNAYDGYFCAYSKTAIVPWRVYVDGVLVTEYGVMGKTREDSKAYGEATYYYGAYRVEKGKTYEITIEIGYTEFAGGAPNRLIVTPNADRLLYGSEIFAERLYMLVLIVFGIFIAGAVVLLLFTAATKKWVSSVSFALVIISLVPLILFSPDGESPLASVSPYYDRINLPYGAYGVGIAVFTMFAVHLILNKNDVFGNLELFVWLFVNLVLVVCSWCFTGTPAQAYTILANICWFDYLFYKLLVSESKPIEKAAYGSMLLIISCIYILETFDYLGMILYSGNMVYTVLAALICVGIVAVYFVRFNELNKKALTAEKESTEKALFKAQVLKSQIKPHFIFNTLTLVLDSYRQDAKKGEMLLDSFAEYMRANAGGDEKTLVSLREEMKTLEEYFELCAARVDGKISLREEISAEDIMVPLLSLQPFVENAIKYSGIEGKEDGYVLIKAYREKRSGNAIIEIIDNGNGFDVNKARKSAVGIKNVKERMSILLNADTQITSVIGKGTTVRITVPRRPRT